MDADRVLELAAQKGLLRTRDVTELGIARAVLSRLTEAGRLVRVERGLYTLPDAEPTSHHSLALVAKQVPQAIVCLLSALAVHELTDQNPFEVWIALPQKAWAPKMDYPPIRLVRFSGRLLDVGVEERAIEGVPVKITSPARTVVDCFRFRRRYGQDVAVEALRDYLRKRAGSVDDLVQVATECRAASVIRPYLEAML